MMTDNRFQLITPNDLADYRDRAGEIAEASWPEFMLHDPIANENWHELFDRFVDYQFALLDTETNRMAAMGNSLPFHWDKDTCRTSRRRLGLGLPQSRGRSQEWCNAKYPICHTNRYSS